MDLNEVIGLANEAAGLGNDFASLRWSKFMENNKEFKRADLWTFKMLTPPKAIYYPGDEVVNARLKNVQVSRASWTFQTLEPDAIRGFKPIGAQPYGTIDMSGTTTLEFVDKQDYAIELFLKSIRDLSVHPETRFSYPIELLMCQMEVAFHNTIQQRTKVFTLFNCVPKTVTVGDDAPADAASVSDYSCEWAFPWHKEEYNNL